MPKKVPAFTNQVMTWGGPGFYPFEDRPELLKLAMRVITDWSALESCVNATIIDVLKAKAPPAMAMLMVLVSASARRDALLAAASTTLGPKEMQILTILAKRFMKRAAQRNKIAHGTWAIRHDIPDGILLIPPDVVSQYALWGGLSKIGDDAMPPVINFHTIEVYEANDFTSVCNEIQKLNGQLRQLQNLISNPPPESDQVRSELRLELGIPSD